MCILHSVCRPISTCFSLSKASAVPRLFKILPQKEQNCAFLMMRFINDSDPMAAENWKGGMEMTKRER